MELSEKEFYSEKEYITESVWSGGNLLRIKRNITGVGGTEKIRTERNGTARKGTNRMEKNRMRWTFIRKPAERKKSNGTDE